MTSTTDTAGHPDVTELSDLTEGLLPPDRSTGVRHHLGRCEPCADLYASLAEIRSLLGTAAEPERMPDDVAARIDAALAAEAPPRADGQDTTGSVSRETPAVQDRPAGRPRATTGPGRKPSERGRRRGRFVLGAVLTAAVLGSGALVVTSFGDHAGRTTAQGTPTPSAGTFSGDSVRNQALGLLAARRGLPHRSEEPRLNTGNGSDTTGVTPGPHTLLQTAVPVPDCVRQALSRSADVLGAKTGTYAGKAAYLVVVADARDSKRVTAYVVDQACVQQQGTTPGKVLLKQSVARH